MTPYQSGIIAEASSDAAFITLNLNPSDIDKAKKALARAPEIISKTQLAFPDAQLHAVIGISHQAWQYFDSKKPSQLAPFPHIKGAEIEITPTDVDLVLHVRSLRHDATYELSNALFQAFGSSVSLEEEVSCFKYLDNRDLTGFVDGTENPAGESRKAVALISDEDAAFKNGSYFNLMKFVHDLDSWEKQDLKTQEDVYGRTKEDDEEYAAEDKSVHAHTKRTSLKDADGKSMEILRHSMPFASMMEKGLMFASYSKDPMIFNLMLESMVKGDEHGNTDHLMKYTEAKTGQAFFVPSNEWLSRLK